MSIPAGWPGRIVQDLLSFIGKGGWLALPLTPGGDHYQGRGVVLVTCSIPPPGFTITSLTIAIDNEREAQ